MVQSNAVTVAEYLKSLPPEQRGIIGKVRQCIRVNLQKGFVEKMNWGMISYEVPLSRFPDTYNGKPLLYCAVAAQKKYYAVYLMGVYAGSGYLDMLERGYHAAGIRLDMGKSCIRFRNLKQIHLPTLGKVISTCTVDDLIDIHQSARR